MGLTLVQLDLSIMFPVNEQSLPYFLVSEPRPNAAREHKHPSCNPQLVQCSLSVLKSPLVLLWRCIYSWFQDLSQILLAFRFRPAVFGGITTLLRLTPAIKPPASRI